LWYVLCFGWEKRKMFFFLLKKNNLLLELLRESNELISIDVLTALTDHALQLDRQATVIIIIIIVIVLKQ
jgi:hypothetical protein